MKASPWIIGGAVLGLVLGGGVVAVRLYSQFEEQQNNEKRYAPYIDAAERDKGLPAGLLHRQLYQESRYRSEIIGAYPDGSVVPPPERIVSSAGAMGIAQIVPRWHPGVDPWDPVQSISYAAKYMRDLFKQFGSWELALAAYNAGPGNVYKYGGVPPFDETQRYVAEILADVRVS